MTRDFLWIAGVAVFYLYNHWQFFSYIESVTQKKPSRWVSFALFFFLNYLLFTVCGYLQLHLIINWSIFMLFLLFEVRLYYHCSWRDSFFHALSGAAIGLAVNIFFRSLLAIIVNVPSSSFDTTLSFANLRRYPVALGFLFAGCFFQRLRGPSWQNKIKAILQDKPNHQFLMRVTAAMYAYLCLNLLVYYTPGNSLILKLWGLKSSAFVLVGVTFAMQYAYRLSRLNRYKEENHLAREELKQHAREAVDLRAIAYLDSLTSCFNQAYAVQKFPELEQKKQPFCLCFADLDGLKTVNDTYGHGQGDQYLLAAADALFHACRKEQDVLCRYGGDEFLLIFSDTSLEEAESRMRSALRILQMKSNSAEHPYPLSVSYGLAQSNGDKKVQDLLKEADQKMYAAKEKRRDAASPRS